MYQPLNNHNIHRVYTYTCTRNIHVQGNLHVHLHIHIHVHNIIHVHIVITMYIIFYTIDLGLPDSL